MAVGIYLRVSTEEQRERQETKPRPFLNSMPKFCPGASRALKQVMDSSRNSSGCSVLRTSR
jgi:DNA invertase Pin-like site-specific DNA recombinase